MKEQRFRAHTVDLTAGEPFTIRGAMHYFRLLDVTGDVTITVLDKMGGYLGDIEDMQEGLAFGPTAAPVWGVMLQSATTQTIKVAYGSDDIFYDRMMGEVDILSGTLTNITDPLTPHQSGSGKFEGYSVAIGTLQTALTPAANLNGAIVTGYGGGSAITTNIAVRFMHKTSAPSAWSDTSATTFYLCGNASNAADYQRHIESRTELPLKIPEGHGLYIQGSSVAVYNVWLNWELL